MNSETTDGEREFSAPLVQIAAALRRFDKGLLNDVAGDAQAFSALEARGLLRTCDDHAGLAGLTEPAQRAAHRLLQRDAPLDEIRHLGAALEYMHRPGEIETPEQRAERERRYFFYFDLLLALLVQRYDWERVRSELLRATGAASLIARAQHLVAMYQGYVEVHNQQSSSGRARLELLLATSSLDPDIQARTLLGIAQSHWYETRFDLAIQIYERLLSLARDTSQPRYEGLALVNMVGAYIELEQYDRALDLASQSLAIFRALDEPVRAAHALYRIGLSAFQLGRWDEARTHFAEAIAQFEALNLQNGLALLYYANGVLALMQGNPQQSEASFRRVLDIAEAPDHAEWTLVTDTYFQMGLLYQTEGRADQAIDAYRRAEGLALLHQRTFLIAQIAYRMGRVLQAQRRLPEALERYQSAIETAEGLFAATAAAEFKLGLLATTPQMYEAIVLLLLELDRPHEAFEYVERARSRAFLDQLSQKSPELFQQFREPVAPLFEIQANLSEGAVLIEYFAIGVLPHEHTLVAQIAAEHGHVREQLAFPPQIWIFMLTRTTLRAARAPIDPNQLRPNPRMAGPARQFLRDRLLTHLYTVLVEPFADLLAGCDQLFLIPHGPLHFVPFLALVASNGAALLRADGPAISFAPSATVLVRGCLQPPRRAAGEFLALGYDDQEGMALEYAEIEAAIVAQRMRGRVLIGDQPKSADLVRSAPHLRGLHIAGHAFFYPDDPLSSTVHLGRDDQLSARMIIDSLHLGADLVVLSACTSGLARVVAGDELFGLPRALISAGARTVVCTLWEASDLVTLILIDLFYAELSRETPPALALKNAQLALRALTGRDLQLLIGQWRTERSILADAAALIPDVPAAQLDQQLYADPYHWAPFLVIGRPG